MSVEDEKSIIKMHELLWDIMAKNDDNIPTKYPERRDDVDNLQDGDIVVCSDETIGFAIDVDRYYSTVMIRVLASKTHKVGDIVVRRPWYDGIKVELMYRLANDSFNYISAEMMFISLMKK